MTVSTEADTPDPLQLELVRALGTPRQWCWLVNSRRLDRLLWICRDATSAAALIEGDRAVPVLVGDDLERLCDVDDDRRLHARLDALAASRKTPAATDEEP